MQGSRRRWPGNLKMYKLALDTATNNVFLARRGRQPRGKRRLGIHQWQREKLLDQRLHLWTFDPEVIAGRLTSSDNPDGPLVERGAVAQALRTYVCHRSVAA
jgi:hypothetical protein